MRFELKRMKGSDFESNGIEKKTEKMKIVHIDNSTCHRISSSANLPRIVSKLPNISIDRIFFLCAMCYTCTNNKAYIMRMRILLGATTFVCVSV